MDDFAQINAVLKEVVKRSPPERATTQHPTGGQNTLFAEDAALLKIIPQLGDTAERKISLEDQADRSASSSLMISLRSLTS